MYVTGFVTFCRTYIIRIITALQRSEISPCIQKMRDENRLVYRVLTTLVLLFSIHLSVFAQEIRINEVMSSNSNTIADQDGDFEDWIEIINISDSTISLNGYGLSDSYNNPFKWTFPDVYLAPGEIMLIWASNKDRRNIEEELHTNFAISAAGEEIVLTRPDSIRVDELQPIAIPTNVSLGRQPDGTGEWMFFGIPTPGEPNTTEGYTELLDKPQFTSPPGFYNEAVTLEISHQDPAVKLFYTLDGSLPDTSANLYQAPVFLSPDSLTPHTISLIRTTPPEAIQVGTDWREPTELKQKAHIVRVVAYKPGSRLSEVVSGTWFIGDQAYSLPVLSIITPSDSLFSDSLGIYVPGRFYNENGYGNDGFGRPNANYYQTGPEWERPASFEWFENQEFKFGMNVGLRLHGNASKVAPMKSLRLYARNEYGKSDFEFPVFNDRRYNSYKRLILRNSGQDFLFTMLKDGFLQTLIKDMNFDTQEYRPSIVYLNGEYWGIHNIRERYDHHYFLRKHGIEEEYFNQLTNFGHAEYGNNLHFMEMVDFLRNNSLSDSTHYATLNTYMDVENYADFLIANIFIGNTDWLGNNIDYWRYTGPVDPFNPVKDGRWRWYIYDLDNSFGVSVDPNFNGFLFATGSWSGNWLNENHTLIFRSLLENESFRNSFILRFTDLLNTTFTTENILSHLEKTRNRIEPYIQDHINRWQFPSSINSWETHMNTMIQVANNRPDIVRGQIIEFFDLGGTVEVGIRANTDAGYINVNSAAIDVPALAAGVNPWKGTYFKGLPVVLQAKPAYGYTFSKWIVNDENYYEEELEIVPNFNLDIIAIFELSGEIENTDEQIIHYWHFNNLKDALRNGSTYGVESDFSINTTAQITYEGYGQGYMDDVAGSFLNSQMSHNAGSALRVRNPSNTRELILKVPTRGFEDIQFSYAVTRTNNGPTRKSLYYSTTGSDGDWILHESNIAVPQDIFVLKVFDFSDVPDISNNDNLLLKFTFDEQASGTSGNNRFDNIVVSGTPYIPPQVPTIITVPRSGAILQPANIEFAWVQITSAEAYQIQISRDEGFNAVDIDTVITEAGLSLDFDLEDLTEYFWRNRIIVNNTPGSWTPTHMFMTNKTLSTDDPGQLPSVFELSQNYPNPFNPTTRIRYSLPNEDHVRLDVFDITGRLVATLVDSYRAAGTYEVTFDGSGLASGVYIYRLRNSETMLTKKLMLIK